MSALCSRLASNRTNKIAENHVNQADPPKILLRENKMAALGETADLLMTLVRSPRFQDPADGPGTRLGSNGSQIPGTDVGRGSVNLLIIFLGKAYKSWAA